jgi:hypothetical protein
MQLNYLPWLENFFEIYFPQMAKNALKLSTMVGEIFEIYFPQMAKYAWILFSSLSGHPAI